MSISAGDLIKAYKDNEVSADKAYKGKRAAVTGVVSSIGKDILDQVYITLDEGGSFEVNGVQCYFKDSAEIDKVAGLEKGDTITVIGTVDGFSVFNVALKKSSIK